MNLGCKCTIAIARDYEANCKSRSFTQFNTNGDMLICNRATSPCHKSEPANPIKTKLGGLSRLSFPLTLKPRRVCVTRRCNSRVGAQWRRSSCFTASSSSRRQQRRVSTPLYYYAVSFFCYDDDDGTKSFFWFCCVFVCVAQVIRNSNDTQVLLNKK